MTSHVVFDSSYVSDTWDWFGSIMFVMDQELWYDPTLGHSHLREFFSIRWPLCWGMFFSVDDGFFWAMSIPQGISDVLFHIGAWDMIDAFRLVYFTQGHTPFDRWWFLGIAVPWRPLVSSHIGVRDMIGWYIWCDHRSIAFSSSLTYFWDDWIRTQTLMRAYNGV